MTNYTRRELLRYLGITSASVAISPSAFALREGRHLQPTPSSGALYVIVQGPWLFSIDANLHAMTIDGGPMGHTYSYFNPRGASPASFKIDPGTTVNFSVSRTTQGGDPKKLFSQMLSQSQGLFYDRNKVSLVNPIPAGVRHLYFPYPDSILSAGLISGVTFTLNGSGQSSQISTWPAALVLVYSSWQGATGPGSGSGDAITPVSQPTFRTFGIQRQIPTPQPGCPGQADDASHATAYFTSLMSLLNFIGGASEPTLSFPACGQTPPTIALGGDSNMQCSDLGLQNGASGACEHLNERSRGPTLVNCAGGGGGIHNCC